MRISEESLVLFPTPLDLGIQWVLNTFKMCIIKPYNFTFLFLNQVITSSIDRSVKVWNLNNVFEQVQLEE